MNPVFVFFAGWAVMLSPFVLLFGVRFWKRRHIPAVDC